MRVLTSLLLTEPGPLAKTTTAGISRLNIAIMISGLSQILDRRQVLMAQCIRAPDFSDPRERIQFVFPHAPLERAAMFYHWPET